MTNTTYDPVLAVAGFSETEFETDALAFTALTIILRDKAILDLSNTIAEALDADMRHNNAATEPPLVEHMPDEAFAAWIEWHEKATAGGRPYESVIMALQMLKPTERAALRERVSTQLKTEEVGSHE
jgi:hypothetical protein